MKKPSLRLGFAIFIFFCKKAKIPKEKGDTLGEGTPPSFRSSKRGFEGHKFVPQNPSLRSSKPIPGDKPPDFGCKEKIKPKKNWFI